MKLLYPIDYNKLVIIGVAIPQLTALPITLREAQRTELQGIVRKHNSPQHWVLRCRIILLADAGVGIHETARRLGITRATVQAWRRRWLTAGAQGLITVQDAPRSGKPAIYTPEQICAIVAIACERPEDSQRAITHWTQQEIANEAIKRGIVEYVSQRSVGRFLKRSGLAAASHEGLVDDEKG
jgi:putative transposase